MIWALLGIAVVAAVWAAGNWLVSGLSGSDFDAEFSEDE